MEEWRRSGSFSKSDVKAKIWRGTRVFKIQLIVMSSGDGEGVDYSEVNYLRDPIPSYDGR